MSNDSRFQVQLLSYLPAIFGRSGITSAFLRAFEATLFTPSARSNSESGAISAYQSIQSRIQDIPTLFDPGEAPSEFLSWLSQWAALSSLEGLSESRRRELIARMIPLYAIRGTRAYLEATLRLYTDASAVSVQELDLPPMQLGVRSNLGYDTRLGEDPFQFRVTLTVARSVKDAGEPRRLLELIHRVITLAKPAHTHYQLVHNLTDERSKFIIHNRSILGVDSFL